MSRGHGRTHRGKREVRRPQDLKALGVADSRGPDASRESHDQRNAEARGLCARAITHAEQQAIDANIFVLGSPNAVRCRLR